MPVGSTIHFEVKQSGFLPKTPRRDIRDMMRESYRGMGIHWHKFFRVKHFTHRGAREYGYEPRDGENMRGEKGFWSSYTGRKLRKFGHTYPLVWSGESAARTRARDVRATSNRAKVYLHANKFNFKNPHSDIQMRKEMTAVSKQEGDELVGVFDDTLQKEIDRYGRRLPG